MSSDYYGAIAGEIADQGAKAEAAFLAWLDGYARRGPSEQLQDDFRAAFMAGYRDGSAP